MVAPLRDLMDRNIFSETEIKAIVARRRESEYLLRRLAARKADFLRYIEQEMALERLRELRTLQRKRDHRKSQQDENEKDNARNDEDDEDSKRKQHIGDVHIVQHVHLLFVRAIRKFRSDLGLHLQHAEFCKQQQSWTRLGRVYAEALQIFPRQSGLWIEAASHEFFGPTRSIRSARVLLQRGLRLNDKSEELWQEYFTLEMHYAQTLKGRRQILQNSNADDAANVEAAKEEYKIACIVLKNAFKTIPESVRFRLEFMDICKRFPNTDFLMNIIQESIRADFASEPESWIARALYEAERQNNRSEMGDEEEVNEPRSKRTRKEYDDADNQDTVLAVLREAIETLSTDDMLLQSYNFATDYQNELNHRGAGNSAVNAVEEYIQEVWAKGTDSTSASLAMEHTRYLVDAEEGKKALDRIKDFCCSTRTAAPAKAWLLWASLAERKRQKGILERALQKISMDHPDYMVILLQLFGEQVESTADDSNLFDLLQRILLLAPKTTGDIEVEDTGLEFEVPTVYEAYLKYLTHANEKYGIKGARKAYAAVLYQSSVTLSEVNVDGVKEFFDTCLQLEKAEECVDKKRLRRLYDKGVEIFSGTTLEGFYREERNNNAIFG
ncbi:MAG: hypothetical protein SGILL_001547 [Bacillariaceae sp.]